MGCIYSQEELNERQYQKWKNDWVKYHNNKYKKSLKVDKTILWEKRYEEEIGIHPYNNHNEMLDKEMRQ